MKNWKCARCGHENKGSHSMCDKCFHEPTAGSRAVDPEGRAFDPAWADDLPGFDPRADER